MRDVEGAVPYKRDRIVFFVLSCNGCNRGLVSSTGERCSPLQICCRNFVRYIYSIFKLHSGCDTSTLQPVPETHLGFTKSQGLYVPASIKTLSTYTRKRGVLLHKKCNNCRNVTKLKYKSFVCINHMCKICA